MTTRTPPWPSTATPSASRSAAMSGRARCAGSRSAPPASPARRILLAPPAADPGITDDERRTIAEMMAKGTYGCDPPGRQGPRRHLRAGAGQRRRGRPGAGRAAVRDSRLRLPRSRGQPDPHPRAALSRPVIAAMCTDAYREALTRDFSSTVSSAPTPTPTPASSQRQAAEPGREGVAGRPLRRQANPGQDDTESRGVAAVGAVGGNGPAMALANGATVVNVEVIDQR